MDIRSPNDLPGNEGLTWYRTPGLFKIHYVPRGTYGRRKYKTIVHSITGVEWQCRISLTGRLNTRPILIPNEDGSKTKELMYTEDQYDIIRSVVWNIHHKRIGMTHAFLILQSLGWTHLPGQTPLSVGKIVKWYGNHIRYRRKGILWP